MKPIIIKPTKLKRALNEIIYVMGELYKHDKQDAFANRYLRHLKIAKDNIGCYLPQTELDKKNRPEVSVE